MFGSVSEPLNHTEANHRVIDLFSEGTGSDRTYPVGILPQVRLKVFRSGESCMASMASMYELFQLVVVADVFPIGVLEVMRLCR